MKPCVNVLVCSTDADMVRQLYTLASFMSVDITIEDDPSEFTQRGYDRVIVDSSYIRHGFINPGKEVFVVLDDEEIKPYISQYDNFIFDKTDNRELLSSLHHREAEEKDVSVTKEHNLLYRGKEVYVTKTEKRYILFCLSGGKPDRADRQILYRLRKKLGKDFNVRGVENEENKS